MADPEPRTEVPDDAPPAGPASAAPFELVLVVLVGTFSAVVWGLMALFRDRSAPPEDGP